MSISRQILLGLIVGATGFFQIADNPMPGISAVCLGGFLILAGIDPLNRSKNAEEAMESDGRR